jgi:integrase
MAPQKRLTALGINKLAKPGLYADGGNLYLQVSAWKTRSWCFRYMIDGKARKAGLGPVDLVSLAEARDKAHEFRRMLLDGVDPIEKRNGERMAKRIGDARGVTFKQCAERYIAAHRAGWRNATHAKQWETTIASTDAVLGSLPVSAVDTGLVLKVLEPVWQRTPETASRLRGRIECVLDYSKARGWRDGENPARWRGHLDQLLPATRKVSRVEHHKAMAYGELPAFMSALRGCDGVAERALEITVLTACRTSEVLGARWDEMDFAAKTWTVPASRTKAHKVHHVPLSDRVLEVLGALPRNGELVFGDGMRLWTMLQLPLVKGKTTVHGMRSSFRDWAAERTNFPREVVEAALAHVNSDKTEAAYLRTSFFDKRRLLMDAWATFCAMPSDAKVIAMRR